MAYTVTIDGQKVILKESVVETAFEGTLTNAKDKVTEIQAALDFHNQQALKTKLALEASLADAQALLIVVTANAPLPEPLPEQPIIP